MSILVNSNDNLESDQDSQEQQEQEQLSRSKDRSTTLLAVKNLRLDQTAISRIVRPLV